MSKAKLTRKQLLERLRELQARRDYESAHEDADKLLLLYIGDHEITEAFFAIHREYA